MSVQRPAFTPFLVISPLLRALPGPAIDAVLAHALHQMQQRHPAVFDRLSGETNPSVLISPTDMQLDLYLNLDAARPVLRRAHPADVTQAAARILGPMPALLELLEGKSDGDALFFSRTLKIEGRTDLVVALRNALDGEDIDLRAAIISSAGVLGPVARRMLALAEKAYGALDRDMAHVAGALAGDQDRRMAGMASSLADLDQRMRTVEQGIKRRQPAALRREQAAMPASSGLQS
ncbi:SCP2 domain-containing protein [Thalassospira sp.]|uniref:ubiquinone anaerobic biosynthesis accessory factor UbiT n=1 Tax=Thalassospira sp. TaxID=1912094 RepID=UPI0027329ABE|nr:SCP2 sterol-binding domain-containing protein [Thalassospira sp.]MDP2697389.1 SCP2 sterol-binding domain-containing protein [Thalassospira sp.]